MIISDAEPCLENGEYADHISKLFEEAKSIQRNSPRLPLAERRAAMEKVSSLEAEAVRRFRENEEINDSLAEKI